MRLDEILVAVLLLLGLVVLAWLAVRRLRLVRGGGVDVAVRRLRRPGSTSAKGWNLGVARYAGDEFVWYRTISLGRRANLTLNRRGLEILDRRGPLPAEEYAVTPGSKVLSCRDGATTVELAMNPGALNGFLAWLEATPPGAFDYHRAP